MEDTTTFVSCQNCNKKLGEKSNNNFKYDPSEIESMTQSIDKDSCYLTLQCPECGCITQIII